MVSISICQDNGETILTVNGKRYKVYFQEVTQHHMAGYNKSSVTATLFGFEEQNNG